MASAAISISDELLSDRVAGATFVESHYQPLIHDVLSPQAFSHRLLDELECFRLISVIDRLCDFQ